MSCVGVSCDLLSCELLSCFVSCAYVYAYVYVVCLRVRCGYVFIFTAHVDGDVGPRAGATPMALGQGGMLNCQTTKTKHCILSIQNTNLFTQDMSDPMFDKSRNVIQTQMLV